MKSKLKPELIAALFPSTVGKPKTKHPQEFCSELDRYGITYSLSKTIFIPRVELHGNDEHTLTRCHAILAANPEIEAWIILHEATKSDNLLEAITERASIQREQGYSDSLYQTVFRNVALSSGRKIKDVKEYIERGANGKPIQRPPRDWEAELKKYR